MLVIKPHWLTISLCVMLLSFLNGCGYRVIAEYDAKTQEEIFLSAKMVNQFYGQLLDTDKDNRSYSSFSDRYIEIEAQLDVLVMRNKVRKLNEDSTDIAERIVKLWRKYKHRHKEKEGYSSGTAKLDRQRFRRMFSYAVRAEGVKGPADKNE